MKFIVVLSAFAAVAAANNVELHVFTDGNCGQEVTMANNKMQANGDCVAINAPFIAVPEMNKNYKYVRPSHVENEVLLFEDLKSCTQYPTTFDKNQQVAFIRTAENGACVPCYHCGNVNSLKMTTMATTTSSASSAAPAVVTALFAAGVTALFL